MTDSWLPVFWTPLAKESLQQVVEFLDIRWPTATVEKVLDAIDATIEQVQHQPYLGKVFPKEPIRRVLIHPHLSLFYEIKPKSIELLLVWDNRQDPDKLRSKLLMR